MRGRKTGLLLVLNLISIISLQAEQVQDQMQAATGTRTVKKVRVVSSANSGGKTASKTAAGTEKKENGIIIPEGLKPGDTIGIIAPANYTGDSAQNEIDYLTGKGFKIAYGQSYYSKWYGFGGTDDARADDINRMFADPNIKAIFAIRGGYGGIRFVDKLNYDTIKKNPKIFSGYSDITTLLLAINEKTGLVTYHGPMSSNFRNIPEETESSFNRTLLSNGKINLLEFDNTYTIMKSGRGEGRITGGNLSLIVASLGTPYEINTDGKILFIEETGEASYRVDRMFQQLKLAGKFKNLKGIILGDFRGAKKQDPTDMTLEEVFYDNFGRMNIPIIKDFKSGHVRPFITVPIGVNAKIDTYKREIIIDNATK